MEVLGDTGRCCGPHSCVYSTTGGPVTGPFLPGSPQPDANHGVGTEVFGGWPVLPLAPSIHMHTSALTQNTFALSPKEKTSIVPALHPAHALGSVCIVQSSPSGAVVWQPVRCHAVVPLHVSYIEALREPHEVVCQSYCVSVTAVFTPVPLTLSSHGGRIAQQCVWS